MILCEGTVTEPHYLDALRRLPEVREIASVKIEIDRDRSGAVPLTLVEAAIEVKNGNDEIDEVWCLFGRRGTAATSQPSAGTRSGER